MYDIIGHAKLTYAMSIFEYNKFCLHFYGIWCEIKISQSKNLLIFPISSLSEQENEGNNS